MPKRAERTTAAAATGRSAAPGTAEARLQSFIDRFDPDHQRLIRAVRKALRRQLRGANELVYDNYNFLVIGYCGTERPSDCILSIAAGASGVGLSFPYCGTSLPDPHKLLQGAGTRNRFIRVPSAAAIERPEVKALITAAVGLAGAPLPQRGAGTLIIRSVSAKQRPRRKASSGIS